LYALADASGVPRGTLSRFMRGERDLTLATAGKVLAALGLRVVNGG
jgi:plasmid maintenance system antidote protein VapI